jgi:signal transduction histidine kinase/CheY-like chemotaxis protein
MEDIRRMNNSDVRSDPLYYIVMSIGQSLDLDEMLSTAMESMFSGFGLSGICVLFFSDSIERGLVYRSVYSNPPHIHERPYFTDAMKSVGIMKRDSNPDRLRDVLPSNGFVNSEGEKRFYHIFLLPYIGLLVLFRESGYLDEHTVGAMIPIGEKLAKACSACLQNMELELMSRSMRGINLDLSRSENELRDNITRIRKAQSELLNNRAHLAMILQSLGEGIMVLDENLNLIVMNVRAMEYLDHVPESVSGYSARDMFANCDTDLAEIKSFIFSSDDDAFIDVRIKSGRRTGSALRISRRRIHDLLSENPEIILLIRDISAELEAERIKNEFISNLSHELRTPMNAILGISKVLLNKGSDNMTARQKEGLSIITESGDRLMSLINDILDLSKIEAGRMEIVHEPFYLKDMLASIGALMKALIGDKEISFACESAPDVPECVVADRKRIEQVIMNLLGNSVKFTEQGGITLRIRRENDSLRFTCEDTGIGIDPKDVPYIFDRFRQVDGSLSRKYSGTGLGLSLSKELVRLMSGQIFVESETGVGTSVHFVIPLSGKPACVLPDKEVTPPENPYVEPPAGDVSVLIVDDEDSARVTLAMMLERDYRLLFAENGFDAFELAKKNRPDVILMDIMMPVLDGIKTLRLLRSDPECAAIPVIALTAHALAEDRERIADEDFDGYLPKPVDESALRAAIRTGIESKKKRTSR